MLFPTRCPVCEATGPAPCGTCVARMRSAPAFTPPAGPGPRHARPVLEPRHRLMGTVLLVDDVTTTGATLTAAACAVRAAGADRVIGLVAARTAAPGDLH